MSWKKFKSNAATLAFVEKAIRENRLGHAFLITGEFSEKTELARHFAASLNCEKADGDACGRCASCTKIFEDRHPDVRIVRPESKARQIRIDEIRELERVSFLKAGEARTKVGILVDADRLAPPAQDAFLKTLEEPPRNTVFLLLTSEPQQLKYTILSRCLRINLFLEEAPVPKDREKRIAGILREWDRADGSAALFRTYRLADSLQTALSEAQAEVQAAVEAEYEGRGYETLEGEQLKKVDAERDAAIAAGYRKERSRLLRVLQDHFRDLAVAHPTDAGYVKAFEALERLHTRLGKNINEALALEVALLELAEATRKSETL